MGQNTVSSNLLVAKHTGALVSFNILENSSMTIKIKEKLNNSDIKTISIGFGDSNFNSSVPLTSLFENIPKPIDFVLLLCFAV